MNDHVELTSNDLKVIALAHVYADDPTYPFPNANMLVLISKLAEMNGRLERDAAFLSFLERWGVDNWDEGYSSARRDLQEWEDKQYE